MSFTTWMCQVVAVRAADWRRLRTAQEKEDFLAQTLSEAGVPLQQFCNRDSQQTFTADVAQ